MNLKERVNYHEFDKKLLESNLTTTKTKEKAKEDERSEKASKNLSSHKLQELSLKYDMSRREIYEMHSTWHSMLDFTF